MARKTFLNGYPLPASDLNTYLMDQTVQTYADATARTAALATPTEGQMSYLADTNTVYVYDGSSWNAVVDAKNYGSVLPKSDNVIINGAFDIWKRSTSYSLVPGAFGYFSADRWRHYNGATGTTCTLSKQTFTPGTAPGAGYEAEAYHRIAVSGWTSGNIEFETRIEDVRTFAGQTATLSFWAKASTATTVTGIIRQNFGSGGSGSVDNGTTAFSVTTSWARYSVTVAIASISGKTVGTGSFLNPFFYFGANTSLDVWGFQLEAGSIATQFARFGGSPIADKEAANRYYMVLGGGAVGRANSATAAQVFLNFPTAMRTAPTLTLAGSFLALEVNVNTRTVTAASLASATETGASVYLTTSGLTAPNMVAIESANNLQFSAEL